MLLLTFQRPSDDMAQLESRLTKQSAYIPTLMNVPCNSGNFHSRGVNYAGNLGTMVGFMCITIIFMRNRNMSALAVYAR